MIPYSRACSGVMKLSRSMSFETRSSGWPVCAAMISSRRRLTFITSRAWISMSVACPSKPPESWWIRIFAFGSAIRFPLVPPGEEQAAIATAIPTHIVWTSGPPYSIPS
jgi:hypothetical protein